MEHRLGENPRHGLIHPRQSCRWESVRGEIAVGRRISKMLPMLEGLFRRTFKANERRQIDQHKVILLDKLARAAQKKKNQHSFLSELPLLPDGAGREIGLCEKNAVVRQIPLGPVGGSVCSTMCSTLLTSKSSKKITCDDACKAVVCHIHRWCIHAKIVCKEEGFQNMVHFAGRTRRHWK